MPCVTFHLTTRTCLHCHINIPHVTSTSSLVGMSSLGYWTPPLAIETSGWNWLLLTLNPSPIALIHLPPWNLPSRYDLGHWYEWDSHRWISSNSSPTIVLITLKSWWHHTNIIQGSPNTHLKNIMGWLKTIKIKPLGLFYSMTKFLYQ